MSRNDQQKNRDERGRYQYGPKCEVCGKPTGFGYCSDGRVDSSPEWGGRGLVLHPRCGAKLAKLPSAEALALLDSKKGL